MISEDELELISWRAGRGCHFQGGFLSESKTVQQVIEDDVPLLIAEIRRLVDFHPRAMKLMTKQKSFLVVANDEPYYWEVYNMIRDHEMEKGTWVGEDERAYRNAAQQSVNPTETSSREK
jgi:hypothetical protein